MPNELQIKEEAFNKMFGWAHAAYDLEKAECCWLLQIEELPDGGLLLEDVILPDQESTGAHTQMQQSGDWLKGIKLEQAVKFRGWGHSHHNMSTFYSGTDDDTLSDKWNSESKNGNHYAVGVVVAFPHDIKAWIVYYKPIATTKIDLPIKVLRPDIVDPMKAIYEAEMQKRLKKKVWSYSGTQAGIPGTQTNSADAAANTIVKDEDWDEGELIDPEEYVVDHISGLSVAQLKANGQWDETIFSDLAEELKEIQQFINSGTFTRKHKNKAGATKDDRICLRQAYNKQGKVICVLHNKNQDCSACKDILSVRPLQKTMMQEMSQSQSLQQTQLPDSSNPPETAAKEESAAPFVAPLSSPASPPVCSAHQMYERSYCSLYRREPDGECPVLGRCPGCPHAVKNIYDKL